MDWDHVEMASETLPTESSAVAPVGPPCQSASHSDPGRSQQHQHFQQQQQQHFFPFSPTNLSFRRHSYQITGDHDAPISAGLSVGAHQQSPLVGAGYRNHLLSLWFNLPIEDWFSDDLGGGGSGQFLQG